LAPTQEGACPCVCVCVCVCVSLGGGGKWHCLQADIGLEGREEAPNRGFMAQQGIHCWFVVAGSVMAGGHKLLDAGFGC
jgi:hypothetical protein